MNVEKIEIDGVRLNISTVNENDKDLNIILLDPINKMNLMCSLII